MNELYPLKFHPIFKERIWGDERLKKVLGKDTGKVESCGESWELSAIGDNISVVSNGFLSGNNLQELIEVYMGDLVGERVYERYGTEFPLLIKFIDAEDDLSIQVHPDDGLSKKRHNAYGKTEMWYVLDADPGSRLNSGFNQPVDRKKYLEYFQEGKLLDLLHFEEVKPGDIFFIPAGRVHAIGNGILLAEIQQTSDVTYRIYDYNRKDKHGKARMLHTDLALDAITYGEVKEVKTTYSAKRNSSVELVTCEYFVTRLLELDQAIRREVSQLESFIIYICVEGECDLKWDEACEHLNKGETLLVPAFMEEFELIPGKGFCRLLEIHYPTTGESARYVGN
jgi:mannose-6-phosphate isomerase